MNGKLFAVVWETQCMEDKGSSQNNGQYPTPVNYSAPNNKISM